MCKVNKKWGDTRIDPCMRNAIIRLQMLGVKTLACCCGHGKYPMSIIVDIGFSKKLPLEIFSNVQIPRKRKFYKKDKQGYYFIPEVQLITLKRNFKNKKGRKNEKNNTKN